MLPANPPKLLLSIPRPPVAVCCPPAPPAAPATPWACSLDSVLPCCVLPAGTSFAVKPPSRVGTRAPTRGLAVAPSCSCIVAPGQGACACQATLLRAPISAA
eukprot:1140266-Pelagomonas_calceolata.AAC.1